MPSWQNLLVAAAAAVFAVFLLARVLPTRLGGRRRVPGLKEQLTRVAGAPAGRPRAAALLEAGALVARGRGPVSTAVGYHLRAMRADPAWVEPIERLVPLMRGRPRALERLLWKRLSQIAWEGDTRPAAARLAELLSGGASVRRFRGAQRKVMARLALSLQPPSRPAVERRA